ncbi:hypothetical protein IT412_01615 [Candidatus Peregrinibacteria bacterium]|nr:hypothetical protein [Candidatus Peregrinibacteria bacterium]
MKTILSLAVSFALAATILCPGLAQAEDVPVLDNPPTLFHYPKSNGMGYCSVTVLSDNAAAVNGGLSGNTITAEAGSTIEVRLFCRYQYEKLFQTSTGARYKATVNGPVGTYKGPAGGTQIGQESPKDPAHPGAELATGFAWKIKVSSNQQITLGWDDDQGHSDSLSLNIQTKAAPATASSVTTLSTRTTQVEASVGEVTRRSLRLEMGLLSLYSGLTSAPTKKDAHGPQLRLHGLFGDGPTQLLVGGSASLLFGHMPIGNAPNPPADGFNAEIDHRTLRLYADVGVRHQFGDVLGLYLLGGVGPGFSFEDTAPISSGPDYIRQSNTHAFFGHHLTAGLEIGYKSVFFNPSIGWASNWSKYPGEAGPEKACSAPTATAGRECFERKGGNFHHAFIGLSVVVVR